jgi:hypothetical protein
MNMETAQTARSRGMPKGSGASVFCMVYGLAFTRYQMFARYPAASTWLI